MDGARRAPSQTKMQKTDLKKLQFPDSPGVYFFKKGKEIIYIGKATSLRDRTRSYFSADVIKTRGALIVDMVTIADEIDFQKTDSVLEALILESNLIKRYQPKYNVKEKDNKSYNYVTISNDTFPVVQVERGRTIEFEGDGARKKYKYIFGPYPHGGELRSALQIIRKIFPFFSKKQISPIYSQIGLEPSSTKPAISEYSKTINHLRLFFEGKKKSLEKELKKQMMEYAKKLEFEKAEKIKYQIFSLQHIRDVSLIKNSTELNINSFRIEAYDIAHQSGQNTVGVMVVLDNNEPIKSDYRKFIIRTAKKGDDVGALSELLTRRLRHPEWPYPNMIVIDGGKPQLNTATAILKNTGIEVVNVVKDEKHNPKDIQGKAETIKKYKNSILLANSEAHRFAITFLRKKESKRMR